MEQYHIIELLKHIVNLLEKKQTAREKHSGIGYGGL
jgi:hypothetical protein